MQNKNKIKNINKRINKIQKKIKNKNFKRRPLRLRRGRRFRRNNISAAYAKGFKKQFSILRQTGSSMRIRGKDLIYQIPDVLETINDTTIMTVIPSNPAYWLGTRMAAIASGYQNYRPIKFHVHYVPQCAVTQQGNVIAGTLWSMSPNKENLQQTLRTSNGGMLTQCYKPGVSKVGLGTNLQFNLYRMGGKFNQESNPFIFIAMSIATIDVNSTRINPGYFYVEYEYELKNPIGDSIKYFTSGIIQNKDYKGNYVNESLINCSTSDVNLGAIIQKDGKQMSWNDQPVQIQDDAYVWYFCNQLQQSEEGDAEPENVIDMKATEITSSYSASNGDYILIISDYTISCLAITGSTTITASSVAAVNNGVAYYLDVNDSSTMSNLSTYFHAIFGASLTTYIIQDDTTVNVVS